MSKQLKLTRIPEEYGKVAVLMGGSSAEREISLLSGNAILSALREENIDAVGIDPNDGLYQQLQVNKIERVFIALHGRDGEDGVVQGFLQSLKIPYTGSNVAGSAIAMDKLISKQIWQQMDFSTSRFIAVRRGQKLSAVEGRRLFSRLGNVLFVKPVKEGSSVGMSKVSTVEALIEAIDLAHQYDDIALVESFVNGKEYTVSIIKGVGLPSISMRTPRDFYDYEAKYQSTETEYLCPSDLSGEAEKQLRQLALNAFSAIGCSGWGRVDFIRDGEHGDFYILEANTVPGMTAASLVPKAAKAVGISFNELVLHILDTSFDNEVAG